MTTDGWGTVVPRAGNNRLELFLLRIVDCGLIGIICIAPFFFGGRHDVGRLVLVSLIAVTAVAWFLRQATLGAATWPRSRAYAIVVLAAAMLVLQIVPLPAQWMGRLSPHLDQLLPLWSSSAGDGPQFGAWRTLSVIPHETTKSLAMLLSYSLLLTVVAGRLESVADVRRMLGWIGLAAVAMAVFGVLQYFTSDGRYFWFFSHPHRSASEQMSGAFLNRNHFAHFLILGVGPLVAWLLHVAAPSKSGATSQQSHRAAAQRLAAWAIAAALTLVVLTSLGSRSRGGAIVLLIAVAVLLGIYFCRGIVDSRFLYGLGGLAVIVCAVMSWNGYDKVVDRLDDLTEGSIEELDPSGIRRAVWAANMASFTSFPIVGTGAGSHREICPAYLSESFNKEYTHAENGYLQIATENGAVGTVLLLALMGTIAWWCLKCLQGGQAAADVYWFGAAAAGLAASAAHAVVDFAWYIPSCMSVTVVLAGCMLRLSQLAGASDDRAAGLRVLRRGRWIELATAALLVGAWNIHTFIGPAVAAVHWDQYLRASVASSELADEVMAELVAGKDAAPQEARRSLSKVMLRHLEAAIDWDPQFARAHRRLADRYLAEFELGVAELPTRQTCWISLKFGMPRWRRRFHP
jgi:O-antigen ligase